MIPTMELRWNRRPDGEAITFWQSTLFGGGKSPRPIGYRLEQKWVSDPRLPYWDKDAEEWRPIPFAEECLDAEPALSTKDQQFWPVAN